MDFLQANFDMFGNPLAGQNCFPTFLSDDQEVFQQPLAGQQQIAEDFRAYTSTSSIKLARLFAKQPLDGHLSAIHNTRSEGLFLDEKVFLERSHALLPCAAPRFEAPKTSPFDVAGLTYFFPKTALSPSLKPALLPFGPPSRPIIENVP